MAKYREILKNKNFLCLWIGQIVSQFGDRLGQMALIGFIHERYPGSAYELAKIISFTILPVFIIGPVAGAYVDRWDKRKTMFASDFIRAFLVLLIPLFLYQAKNLITLY
ncbi:MAG: MFS transporter, partial [Candidatus Omnitrophota bacterium]